MKPSNCFPDSAAVIKLSSVSSSVFQCNYKREALYNKHCNAYLTNNLSYNSDFKNLLSHSNQSFLCLTWRKENGTEQGNHRCNEWIYFSKDFEESLRL